MNKNCLTLIQTIFIGKQCRNPNILCVFAWWNCTFTVIIHSSISRMSPSVSITFSNAQLDGLFQCSLWRWSLYFIISNYIRTEQMLNQTSIHCWQYSQFANNYSLLTNLWRVCIFITFFFYFTRGTYLYCAVDQHTKMTKYTYRFAQALNTNW